MCSPRREPLGPLPFDFPDLCISTELPLFIYLFIWSACQANTETPGLSQAKGCLITLQVARA